MSLYPEMHNASFAQLVAWWQQPGLPEWIRETEDEDFSIEDARASLLSETAFALAQSDEGRAFLRRYLYAEDVVQRQHALAALAQKECADDTIIAALMDAFHTNIAPLRREALIGFHRLARYPITKKELEATLGAADDLTAAWAMACLSEAYPDEALPLLQRGLADPRPRVREMACDIAGDNDIRTLTNSVSKLRADADVFVRQAADTSYRTLTGSD